MDPDTYQVISTDDFQIRLIRKCIHHYPETSIITDCRWRFFFNKIMSEFQKRDPWYKGDHTLLIQCILISFRSIGIGTIFVRGWLSGIDPVLSLIKSRDHIRYFSFVSIRKVKDAIQVRSYIFKRIVSVIFSRQRKTLWIFSRKSHRSYIRRRRSRVENSQRSRIRRSIK